MLKTKYYLPDEINELQTNIMIFIDKWVRSQKTPVPKVAILKEMRNNKIGDSTTDNAINTLLKEGYIRRGYSGSNKTCYVLLHTIKY